MSYYIKRDYQRSKVYRWEKETFKDEYMLSLREIAHLIEDICSDYKIPTPKLKDGRGRRSPAAYAARAVAFPRHGRSVHDVLHEMAHIIHARWCKKTGRTKFCEKREREVAMDVAHGPRFVDIMLYLRHVYVKQEPYGKWFKALRSRGIDFNEGFGRKVYELLSGEMRMAA